MCVVQAAKFSGLSQHRIKRNVSQSVAWYRCLEFIYRRVIWQASPQQCCGDACQILQRYQHHPISPIPNLRDLIVSFDIKTGPIWWSFAQTLCCISCRHPQNGFKRTPLYNICSSVVSKYVQVIKTCYWNVLKCIHLRYFLSLYPMACGVDWVWIYELLSKSSVCME